MTEANNEHNCPITITIFHPLTIRSLLLCMNVNIARRHGSNPLLAFAISLPLSPMHSLTRFSLSILSISIIVWDIVYLGGNVPRFEVRFHH